MAAVTSPLRSKRTGADACAVATSTKPSSTLVRIPKPDIPPNITSPRFARATVSGRGKPITNGTSLGGPPFGIGKTSIGERVKASHTAHVAKDRRRPLPPTLTKSTQLAIKKGKLTNRNASNQKKDEDSRRRANPTNLIAFATFLRIAWDARSCDQISADVLDGW